MRALLPLFLCCLLALTACAPQPAATSAPSTQPQPSATPTTPPTATIVSGEACLQGDWLLNSDTTANLLAYISTIPSMAILEGALRLRFEEDLFAYHSDDLFLRTSFLEGYLDARANVLIEGNYTVDGDKILFTKTGAQNELYDWRAVDSQGTPQPFYSTSPVINFNIAEKATYTCSEDALMLTFDVADLNGLVFTLERIK